MDAIRIRGARPLYGTIPVGGAKNAALPILCATLLSDGDSLLRNVPGLRDIDTTAALLRFLGREVRVDIPEVRVARATQPARPEAPYELVRQMRASVLVLGPLWILGSAALLAWAFVTWLARDAREASGERDWEIRHERAR